MSEPLKNAASPASEPLTSARDWLRQRGEEILAEQVELAGIPAPPFQEQARAERIEAKLYSMGIRSQRDEIGNVLARFPPGKRLDATPPVVVAAHLDTVFGPETRIEIEREAVRCTGPGIADNARGLAVSLSVLRALLRAGVEPSAPVVFAFTVGEEGRGDLRGVKHLFRPGSPLRDAAAFVAVDGGGLRRIIHRAVGCRRFLVTIRGPGGHSWTDWGRVNPALAIGGFVSRLATIKLPRTPRSTLTVARLGGGTSINAIPATAWVELDLRSEAPEQLQRLDSSVRRLLAESLAAEAEDGEGRLEMEVELIGERPAGSLASDHPLVLAAVDATRALGVEPEYAVSSTDANVPLSLGVPAIALGGGGRAGDTHTEHEWFEDSDGPAGALRLLQILGLMAGF